jgi:hypothetical protein
MSIEDYFKHVGSKPAPVLRNGAANTIGEFFEQCVEGNLPSYDSICRWDDLLNQYVDDPEAIFFVRRNASNSAVGENVNNGSRWDNRRGFMTVHRDGLRYVFVDNSFSLFFFSMAYNKYYPDYEDFKQFILNRKIRCGMFMTPPERNLGHNAFRVGAGPKINKNGWKLSHIFSANGSDYNFDYDACIERLFPCGSAEQYYVHDGETYPYRFFETELAPSDKKKIKAHFLRVVHPINYFLTPMPESYRQKNQIFREGSDIGEYKPVIDYCRKYLQNKYGRVYDNFVRKIKACDAYPTESIDVLSRKQIHVQYGKHIAQNERNNTDPTRVAVRPRTQRARQQNTNAVDHNKVRNRIAGWASKTDSKVHKILKAFFAVCRNGKALVNDVEQKCSNARHQVFYIGDNNFINSLRSLKTDAGNSYGKVFEQSGDHIKICEEARAIIEEYRDCFS